MKERDCANCKHHTSDGCTKWDCEFEAKLPKGELISKADAIELLTEIVFDEPPYFDSETLCRLYAEEQINKLPSADAVSRKAKCCPIAETCMSIDCPVSSEYVGRPSADAVPYCSTREVSWAEPRTWHEKNSHTYICGDCGFEQAIYGNINEYNCCPRCGVYKEYVDYGCIFPQKRTPYREDGDME